jgi:predicted DNA-binding protein (UPF0251 family)
MKKPYRIRIIQQPPVFTNFKPSGIPRKFLKKAELTIDEFEAIRLADYSGMEHQEAADSMQISRPTFTRLIKKAHRKMAVAIIEGMELTITGGNFELLNTLHLCQDCGDSVMHPLLHKTERCRECGSENIKNLAAPFIK